MRAWAMSRPKVGLEATHAPQRTISCPVQGGEAGFVPWLRSVFVALQAWNYSPNGVTRKRGVDHVSMTVGDIMKIGEKLFVVGLNGFYVISTLDPEANIRRLEETPSENAFGVLPPGLPPLSPVPALTPEMGCLTASSSELVTLEITVPAAPVCSDLVTVEITVPAAPQPDNNAGAQEGEKIKGEAKVKYEEEMDEPGWHRPLDRRAYRAQFQRQRAALKACQAAKQAVKLVKGTKLI